MKTSGRLLNRDGTFNISPVGLKVSVKGDMYHFLLSLSWRRLLVLLICFYIFVNAVFALLYVLCGAGALSGIAHDNLGQRFSDAFFFSVQTFSTIGYGKITPVSVAANILVTFEALTGLLSVALATGLIFARFSRPTARVMFSNNAVIAPHDGVPSFIFRLANERANQIVEATVRVALSINEVTKEGEQYRTFYDLKLERSQTAILVLSWTIVHAIDKLSPLYNMTDEKLRESEAEFMVTLTGIDETFSQTVNARFSYTADEIIWNKRFGDMLTRKGKMRLVDMSKIHTVVDNPSQVNSHDAH